MIIWTQTGAGSKRIFRKWTRAQTVSGLKTVRAHLVSTDDSPLPSRPAWHQGQVYSFAHAGFLLTIQACVILPRLYKSFYCEISYLLPDFDNPPLFLPGPMDQVSV